MKVTFVKIQDVGVGYYVQKCLKSALEILKIRFLRHLLCIVAEKLTFEKFQGVGVGYNARDVYPNPHF